MAEETFIPGSEQLKQMEFKRLGYRLLLETTPDSLKCLCRYEPSPGGAPMTLEELNSFLEQAKVIDGVNEESVSRLLEAATSNEILADLTLATGIPMLPGDDGKILLTASAPEEEVMADVDDDEALTVDFHVVQKFVNVAPGQLIGTVVPPGEGTPGRNVRGLVIPAQPGAPIKLVLGQNVRLGDDGCSIFAETDGRVFCNGAEISVEDIYTIKGDVDFKVGNIDFSGFVDISGDVLDGFTVKAKKGVKVKGNVGVCSIESDGDIIFCGMNGQGKGSIKCGGSITANFIDAVQVECAGDILVESEIRNSCIKSLATVRVNKGVISGGECIALGGVESSTIGTGSSLHTLVVVGVNYLDMAEFNRLFSEMKQLIADFNAKKGSIDPKEFMKERAEIAERLQQVRTRQYEGSNAKVNVKKMLHEGVTITLGEHSEEIREERKGPVSIIENTTEGGIRYLGMTDLSVDAKDIERAFVQQHEKMLRSGREVAR